MVFEEKYHSKEWRTNFFFDCARTTQPSSVAAVYKNSVQNLTLYAGKVEDNQNYTWSERSKIVKNRPCPLMSIKFMYSVLGCVWKTKKEVIKKHPYGFNKQLLKIHRQR